jgi:hypothetical protein
MQIVAILYYAGFFLKGILARAFQPLKKFISQAEACGYQ